MWRAAGVQEWCEVRGERVRKSERETTDETVDKSRYSVLIAR